METSKIVTITDYNRLMELIAPIREKRTVPPMVEMLFDKLSSAKLVPQEEISSKIITMNSRALLKNLSNGWSAEILLAYPKDSDQRKTKISVFTNIGIALLGCKEGQITTWQTPTGWGQFVVEEVMYQPEAAKEFQL